MVGNKSGLIRPNKNVLVTGGLLKGFESSVETQIDRRHAGYSVTDVWAGLAELSECLLHNVLTQGMPVIAATISSRQECGCVCFCYMGYRHIRVSQ